MRPREGSELRFATPLKVVAQKFAFLLLLGAAIGMVILGKADTVLVERVRTQVADAFVPILDAISRPVATVNDGVQQVQGLIALRSENQRLIDENRRLRSWESVARQLESENRAFRDLLSFAPEAAQRFTAARVVGDSDGAFVHSVLVNAGERDGVRKGQAAVNGEGLVGRVAEVGERSARVLLVTDLNSRIPVRLESQRTRAILAGDNSQRPRLLYLLADAKVSPGDRIVTSGHGGVFPPGLPVGVVTLIANGDVRVQPFVDWERLEYVRLIEFSRGEEQPAQPKNAAGDGLP